MSMKAVPTIALDTTAGSPIVSPAPQALSDLPTLDQVLELIAQNERAVVRGVDWDYYSRLLEAVGEKRGIRLAYDGKDLEIMSPGPFHDDVKGLAGKFVEVIAEEFDLAWRNLGSTTWKRPALKRGIEADQCYYFQSDKLAQARLALKRKSNDVADYPNPDLAIEVDISPSEVDRAGIYAALRVMEVWRIDAIGVTIERLNDDGTFGTVDTSGFLPVRANDVARWVLEEDTGDVRDWMRRVRTWAGAELRGRSDSSPPSSA
jgi:Uma2 family endonuclease